jgi:hypothetical protein
MTDWASGVWAKIERAKEHIKQFDLASQDFLKTHAYSALSKFDPQSRNLTFVVQKVHTIDPRLACITADAIHNLRVPLDILWHQVWSRGAPGYRKQYFPFVENAHELETRFKSVKKGPRKTAVDILLATKSYKSGHKFLGAIDEIDVRDKHEVPLLAAATSKRVIMKLPPDVIFQGKSGVQFVSELDSGFVFLEEGTELPTVVRVETDRGPVMDMECQLTPYIAFGQGEILEGEPILEALHEMAQLVEAIASGFRTEGLMV